MTINTMTSKGVNMITNTIPYCNIKTDKDFDMPSFLLYDHILSDKKLIIVEKVVYAFFYHLYTNKKCIHITNGYLASILNLTKRRVQQIVQSLEAKGYIARDLSNNGFNTIVVLERKEVQEFVSCM